MANKFETEISSSFKQERFTFPVVYIKLVVNHQVSYGITTPCDSLVDVNLTNGNPLALELKEIRVSKSFPFSRLPEHQEQGLLKFHQVGRKAYILLCFREARKSRAFALDIRDYLTYKANTTRKSIPLSEIESLGIELNRLPKSLWDVSILLK
jgi:penicillin-binding protein-related factor A (putative recombinase)